MKLRQSYKTKPQNHKALHNLTSAGSTKLICSTKPNMCKQVFINPQKLRAQQPWSSRAPPYPSSRPGCSLFSSLKLRNSLHLKSHLYRITTRTMTLIELPESQEIPLTFWINNISSAVEIKTFFFIYLYPQVFSLAQRSAIFVLNIHFTYWKTR